MAITTLSSKGQMIVPKRIRDALALKPGIRLIVEALDRQSFRVRTEARHQEVIENLAGSLRQPGRRRPMTIAEMDAAVMRQARSQDARTKRRRRAA